MNKKIKGVIALLLTLCLAFTQFTPNVVHATTEPTLEVSGVSGRAGEEVDVKVSALNNPGIAAALLKVEYDTSVMTLTKVTDAGIWGSQLHSNNYTSPYTLNWANDTATENITANGVIVTLTFKLIEDIEETQSFDVKLSYNNALDGIMDKDLNAVDFAVVNGAVTIQPPYRAVAGISLEKEEISLIAGQSEKLAYTLEPTNATNKNVSWTSTDNSVATVDAEGNVTALKKGTTTITVTTEDGQKTASCVVTVACAHSDVQHFLYVEPSCTEKGHKEFAKCLQCNEVIEGEDAEIDKVPHTLTGYERVEATHTEDGHIAYWECSECEQKFSDSQGTTVVTDIIIPKNEDDHVTEGDWVQSETEHWISCGCGNKINLGEHNYTDTCDTTCNTCEYVREITHTWEEQYTTNDTQHWISCSVCGAKKEEVDHTFTAEVVADKYLKTVGTCKDKAVYYKSCATCGVKGTETFETEKDADNHAGGTYLVGEKETTCYEEGYTGDTHCTGCDAKLTDGQAIPTSAHSLATTWSTDGTYHWHECTVSECTYVADKTTHSGGEATCIAKATCSACNVAYGEFNANTHKNTEVREEATPTCKNAGYTGDTWCTDCETKLADGETIPATGAHVDANGQWESNGTQHFHTCVCGTEFDKTNHSGGTATCKDKAICSICENEYGEVDSENHVGNTRVEGQKEATCYEEGYTGDTYCSDCNVKIAEGESIPTTAHNPASVWSTDETHHWHECQVIACGNIIDKAEHSGGEATCISKAICTVCNVAYGTIDANKHVNTEIRDDVIPTCIAAGYTGDTWCTDCETKIAVGEEIPATGDHIDLDGQWESNGTQHFHTCVCGTEFDKTNHSGGTATCKDKAECAVCGTAYDEFNSANHVGGTHLVGEKETTCYEEGYTGDTYCTGCETKLTDGQAIPTSAHSLATTWTTDQTYHWHECTVSACTYIVDKSAHSGGTATCKDKVECSVCGTAYGEIDKDNHVGGTELKNVVTVSCAQAGYTGDTYCKGCNVVLATGQEIPKLAHNITGWTVTKQATEDETGIKTGTCTGCSGEFTVEIAKLVKEIKEEKIETNVGATVEVVGDTKLPGEVIFVADDVTTKIENTVKEVIETVIESVQEQIESLTENHKIGTILDMKMVIREFATNGDAIEETEHKLEGTVEITIDIPQTVINTLENIVLLHIKDDGSVEEVPFTREAGNKARFKADGFSYYVFAGTEKVAADNNTGNTTENITQKPSGDTNATVFWMATMLIACAGAAYVLVEKKRNR